MENQNTERDLSINHNLSRNTTPNFGKVSRLQMNQY